MGEIFRKGKVYKFSLDKYRRNKWDYEESIDRWAKWCDQKIVDVENCIAGRIDGYPISPMWCVEA